MEQIPDIPSRSFGDCDNVPNDDSVCSFDCYQCSSPGDIHSCNPLSQTFDDGPTEYTESLVMHLKKSKTKTTFFLVGRNVVDRPDVVRLEKRHGHLLAVHTWSHKFLPSLSNEEIFAELQWTIWAINATAGVIPRYFRPPYGGVDNRVRAIARQLGLVNAVWDTDTADWHLNDGSKESSELKCEFDDWLETTNKAIPAPPKRKWYQFTTPKKQPPKGLILEHDLSEYNVELAKHIKSKIRHKQKTVAQCVKMKWYQ